MHFKLAIKIIPALYLYCTNAHPMQGATHAENNGASVKQEISMLKAQLNIQTARLQGCLDYHEKEMARIKQLYDIRNSASARAVRRFTELSKQQKVYKRVSV